jgi:hypothetical protein
MNFSSSKPREFNFLSNKVFSESRVHNFTLQFGSIYFGTGSPSHHAVHAEHKDPVLGHPEVSLGWI